MSPAILRLLDANANRSREALRVLEDYARFIQNDGAGSGELKRIRHALAAILGPLLPGAMVHRDVPRDVGRENKTGAELTRADLPHVVTAAGKRLGEALRSLEEYLKIDHPAAAAEVESLRYAFYGVEQSLARTLRPGSRFAAVRLYVLITERLCRLPWEQAAEQALVGGADCLQLREKDLESGELLRRAKRLVQLCARHNAISIINDRPDIALLSDADGVHVGQGDLPAVEARKIVGAAKLVGVSTHNRVQARQAALDGADYIGVGPIFPSRTKPRDILPGLAFAREAAAEITIPTVAIAGITATNAAEVFSTGVQAIAVTAAVVATDDVAAAARELKTKVTAR